jgi:hypothetical protein
MDLDTGRGVMVAVALAMGLSLTAGCATQKGRGAVGGAVYGTMIGTSIFPGIGSAIGAGVGMVAGVVEGTQKEKEAEAQEDAYRRKFYPSEGTAERIASARTGAHGAARAPEPSGRFSNLIALQEDQPLETLLGHDVRPGGPPAEGAGSTTKAPRDPVGPEGVGPEPAQAKLYQELAALRSERRALEAQVARSVELLEEYDRSGRSSQMLLDQIAGSLGMSRQGEVASPSGTERGELLYLQQEYEIALQVENEPLAEAVARRFERLSGRRPLRPPVRPGP